MSVYDTITANIIAELEKGCTPPWVRSWNGQLDTNVKSGNAYNGINRLVLMLAGLKYDSTLWGTYNQWQKVGGQVRRGEKSTVIVFYGDAKTEKDGEEHFYKFAKAHRVFNLDQVDNVEHLRTKSLPALSKDYEHCDLTIKATNATVKNGGDRACFVPSMDIIKMPYKEDFISLDQYYCTAFHELTHWSGHKTRLKREFGDRFGDKNYAFEELVAELGSAFLSAEHNLVGDLRHAGYIESWLEILKSDKKAIFTAASLAQKAVTFINSFKEIKKVA